MTSGPPNLKRPWEVENTSTPTLRPQYSSYAPPSTRAPEASAPQGYMAPQSYQPLGFGAEGTPPAMRELQHKRSRVEMEAAGGMDLRSGYYSARVSPTPGSQPLMRSHLPPRLPSGDPSSTSSGGTTSPGASVSSPPGYHGGQSSKATVLPPSASMPGSGTFPIYQTHQPPLPTPSIFPPQQQQQQQQQPQPQSQYPISPAASHLADLQHALSTKTIALSVLQSEHEKLLASLERLHARFSALDRKSKAADDELALLHEERSGLAERVECLEREAEEARAAREQVMEERERESTQWRRIIELGGTLQRRHAGEEEKWKEEKRELVERVEGLEGQLKGLRGGGGEGGGGSVSGGGTLDMSSPNIAGLSEGAATADLRGEVLRLRVQAEEARRRLEEYESNTTELSELLHGVRGVSERLQQLNQGQGQGR